MLYRKTHILSNTLLPQVLRDAEINNRSDMPELVCVHVLTHEYHILYMYVKCAGNFRSYVS